MGKYYKRPHKKSYAFYSGTVAWPNHKYSFATMGKVSKRRKKKFLKYEYYNEDLFTLLFGAVEDYKAYPVNLDWHTIEDAEMATKDWYVPITTQEDFDTYTKNYKHTMKPRWRSFMSADEFGEA